VLFLFSACSNQRFRILGRVVSYADRPLKDAILNYFVVSSNKEEVVETGATRIRAKGKFTIQVTKRQQLPYWVIIEGVSGVTEASIMNISYEVSNYSDASRPVWDVFCYDYIEIIGDFSRPILLRDLNLQWKSNIPDVDFFRLRLPKKLTVSGIKATSFSFSALGTLPREPGKYMIGDVELDKESELIAGNSFLIVQAVRLIDGKAVFVATSALDSLVTIIGE
jgi:hypothetical protein